MLRPCPPIDGRRSDRFRPPFCPHEGCPAHTDSGGPYVAKRDGSYRRQCDPLRRVQRFRCGTCGRGFSQRSFATTYRLKRPELLAPVAALLVAGSANRQIARSLGCSHSTVTRMSVRLGRHATLFQRWTLAQVDEIREPIVFDHFETFVRSQVERLGVGTAVGDRSWFVYGLDGARYLRVGGRSTRKRALKRSPIPVRKGVITDSTARLLQMLLAKSPGGLDLVSDDHPSYTSVVRKLQRGAVPIRHSIFANPDRSPKRDRARARRRDRGMFAVDLVHKLIRHSQAHHRRETIAFGRRVDYTVGRLALFAVWRNFVKRRSERRVSRSSPAMDLGLTDRLWSWVDVLAVRLFEQRAELPTT